MVHNAASVFAVLRAASRTHAPALASARAVSRPSPPDAPVTTASLPVRSTPCRASSVVLFASGIADISYRALRGFEWVAEQG